MDRKLVTIVAADVVGFSRLVGSDEEATLRALRGHRQDFIDPLIQQHGGRIANTAGDSLLIEFPSPVEATRCAVAMQDGMTGRTAATSQENRIAFRIGINLGDVVDHAGDLLGDGVNIAARLEALAPSGGIVISRAVRDQVRDRLDRQLADLGEVTVKNIARPVRAFQVLRAGETPVKPPRPHRRPRIAIVALAVLAAVALGAWLVAQRPDFTPVDPADMALELPGKPSIAVLPFETRGDGNGKGWIADGVTESIISTLSLAPDMIVIARSTILKYKDQDIDAPQVARELGVRYVLGGSVLSLGDTVRVTAELADAIEGKQLWALKQEGPQDDLLTLLDGISRRVFEEMSVSLTVGEGTRSWIELAGGFENYVQVINGRAEFQKWSPEAHAKAERIWGKLLRDNPDQAFANYLMGYIFWQKVRAGFSTDPATDLAEANRLARRALDIEEFGEGYTLLAALEMVVGHCDGAIAMADKAVALSPGSSDANSIAGFVKAASGQPAEGLALMEFGMRLEPDYPEWLPGPLNLARIELGRYAESDKLARDILASDAQDVRAKPYAAMQLVASAVFQNDMPEAHRRVRQLLKIKPDAVASDVQAFGGLYRNQDFIARYTDALVAAGVPAE